MASTPPLRITGAREARDSWADTVERVTAGEHQILLRNAAATAVILPPEWYAAAVQQVGEPPMKLRALVAVASARTNWSATVRMVEDDGKHVLLLRHATGVAYLVPTQWYAQTLEALGGPRLNF
ncbi:type II toxin-antitoxin system Phd/YefM family antitoxin [Micromonospora maritima]|uniref:type II toxin-antitoxin system Phd/YefM family antitoxin n=1 Tax=Micromonospora maritima TaxID=986711 RepID=UPI00157CCF7F|nr:type II toxin-antitoxin system Phd/YefM family antitoxin [Micromonospora maritima]